MLKDCLIIGFGNIGKKLFGELISLEPDVIDKYHPEYSSASIEGNTYKIGFICVDTPLLNGRLDTTEIRNAIKENRKRCNYFCIKSTVPVGFKATFGTNKRTVYSPEFYGTTVHSNFKFNFTILGGDPNSCEYVLQTILPCYDGSHKFMCVSPREAQMAKFMENAFLATKVSFCNSFYEMCEDAGINYSTVRELFLLDPRFNCSHTLVYEDHPYWDSHCLNKDVPAIANQFDNSFLKGVIKYNEEQKKKHGQIQIKNKGDKK